jgi:heme/copper-type cytochrome/quinol oxidase subunit 2
MNPLKSIYFKAGATLAGLALPVAALAENPFTKAQGDIGTIGGKAYGTGGTPPPPLTTIIGNIINVALGFLGILLLVYLIYAGFLWMTAGGAEDKVKEAKKIIINCIIGMIIVVAAYAISSFVLTSLIQVTTG